MKAPCGGLYFDDIYFQLQHNIVSLKATGGGDVSYVYNQSVPSTERIINHNLGKYPNITTLDSNGIQVIGDIYYTNENTIKVIFSEALSGVAYLN